MKHQFKFKALSTSTNINTDDGKVTSVRATCFLRVESKDILIPRLALCLNYRTEETLSPVSTLHISIMPDENVTPGIPETYLTESIYKEFGAAVTLQMMSEGFRHFPAPIQSMFEIDLSSECTLKRGAFEVGIRKRTIESIQIV